MTKENKHTYVALVAFFFILVILGTLNKTEDTLYPANYKEVADQFVIPELPELTGDPVLTTVQLPVLENLPEITGIVSPTEDELPHLTLPALEG